jgi:hypothetical protein
MALLSLVVVHDLDVLRVPVAPRETDPPLVIDTDAVLPGAVASQRLKPVSPDRAEVGQACCRMQPAQPFARLFFDASKPAAAVAIV